MVNGQRRLRHTLNDPRWAHSVMSVPWIGEFRVPPWLSPVREFATVPREEKNQYNVVVLQPHCQDNFNF